MRPITLITFYSTSKRIQLFPFEFGQIASRIELNYKANAHRTELIMIIEYSNVSCNANSSFMLTLLFSFPLALPQIKLE